MLLYHYLYENILPYIRLRSLFLCTTSSVRRLYYTAHIYTSHTRRLYTDILSKFFVSWRWLGSDSAGSGGNRGTAKPDQKRPPNRPAGTLEGRTNGRT